ncbi:MAG: protein kinase [Myxococcota bacterium]
MQESWITLAERLREALEKLVPFVAQQPIEDLLLGAAVAAAVIGLFAVLVTGRTRRSYGQRPEDIERAVQRLIEQNDYSRAGDLRAGQGDFEKALALYSHAGNQHRVALCYLSLKQPRKAADTYRSQGRLAEAAHHYQTAGAWLEAAQCLQQLGSDREAAELYERAGDLPKAAHLLRALGDAESAARLFERADLGAEAAAALIQAHGRDARTLKRAGALFRAAGESYRAAECFAGAGEWIEAAAIFEERGELMLAAQAFERGELWDRAGTAYERAGALPEARVNFERAGDRVRVAQLALEMGDLLDAGRGFHQLGAIDRAIEILQQIPPDTPKAREARLELGRIFVEKGLFPRAREQLEVIAPPEPTGKDDVEILRLLARAYEGMGELLQAVQLLEQVAEIDPHNHEIEEQLEALQERAWSESNPPPGYFDARYELQGEIGRGGMGVVYRAHDRELDRSVAIKFLPGELAVNASAVTMFRAEARAAAAMNHPNIVHIYDVAVLSGRPCIIMELVPGQTARQLLKDARSQGRAGLGPRRVAEITQQIARALGFAHGQSVVHRDVKPSNILITRSGEAKLMDFGISKVLEAQGDAGTDAKGTPQYMPPEQILGREIDGRTDLYALGISMFELALGRRPFIGDKVLDQQLHDPIPDPRSIDASLPEDLSRIIERLCEKNPDDRYASADELCAALEVFLNP